MVKFWILEHVLVKLFEKKSKSISPELNPGRKIKIFGKSKLNILRVLFDFEHLLPILLAIYMGQFSAKLVNTKAINLLKKNGSKKLLFDIFIVIEKT